MQIYLLCSKYCLDWFQTFFNFFPTTWLNDDVNHILFFLIQIYDSQKLLTM